MKRNQFLLVKTGIEPVFSDYDSVVLPLNYFTFYILIFSIWSNRIRTCAFGFKVHRLSYLAILHFFYFIFVFFKYELRLILVFIFLLIIKIIFFIIIIILLEFLILIQYFTQIFNIYITIFLSTNTFFLRGKRELNSQLTARQAVTLPIELFPLLNMFMGLIGFAPTTISLKGQCSTI